MIDVATALQSMITDDSTASETYELYGPKEYSAAQIAELVDKEIINHRRHVNIPKLIFKIIAAVLNRAIWWHTISPDEVEREFMDQKVDSTAKTFKDLGIEPAELSGLTYQYLVCLSRLLMFLKNSFTSFSSTNCQCHFMQQGYRTSAYYDLPPATEREKREEKRYLHVIDDQ